MTVTVYNGGASITVVDTAPPVVIPPPVSTVITQEAMNLSRMVVCDGWCQAGARYTRFQTLIVLKGATTASVPFNASDFNAGGVPIPFGAASYDLLLDDVKVATKAVAAGTTKDAFTVGLATLADGWHKAKIPVAGPETSPTWFLYVQKSGKATAQPAVPVYTGSYDVAHNGYPHTWALVPGAFAPTPKPLAARTVMPFATALPIAQLHRTNIVPCKEDDLHRPNVNVDGIVSTFCRQAYDWSQLIGVKPQQALLDGVRGVGAIAMPTHMQVGHNGGVYALHPWGLMRGSTDGTLKTLFGYRHPGIGSYWQDPSSVELVGDWSAVSNKGLHEAWGFAWDPDSLALDPNAAPINGLQPHLIGPRMFVADTQNNRILLATFSKNDPVAPAVMTEFITGLSDPWDIVAESGALYITQRTANRITKHDIQTGAFLATVVFGASGLATIRSDRTPIPIASLAAIQNEPCCQPEGLFLQDGFLYYGSMVQQQVRKVSTAGGTPVVVCAPHVDGNSKFMKIALSDGTFGPRGTVFVWTWSNADNGYPEAFLPGGTKWTLQNSVNSISGGRGGSWIPQGYGSSGAVGLGRFYMGSSEEGMVMLTQANADDPAPDYAKYVAGHKDYNMRGFHVVYGEGGYGYQGLPLPFGTSPEIDYYLHWNGH